MRSFRPLSGLNRTVSAGQVNNKKKREKQADKDRKVFFLHNFSSFCDHKINKSRFFQVKPLPTDSF